MSTYRIFHTETIQSGHDFMYHCWECDSWFRIDSHNRTDGDAVKIKCPICGNDDGYTFARRYMYVQQGNSKVIPVRKPK
jgi:rRNA maturation endonuclease Nob1